VLRLLAPTALFVLMAIPSAAMAATVAATTLPDTTYTVTVQKVVDAKNVVVVLENGDTTTLTAGHPTMVFTALKPGDSLKLSLSKGQVLVFIDLTATATPAP